MKLLALDTETTGTSESDKVIEVAAALYETKTKFMLWAFSSLVAGPAYNPAERFNDIPPGVLPMAEGFYDPFEEVNHYADLADAIVAHNAEFDYRMLKGKLTSKTLWVCSYRQLRFPRTQRSRTLSHIATDHGVLAVGAHRALGDVLMLVALFRQVPDLEEQIENAKKPPSGVKWEAMPSTSGSPSRGEGQQR